MHQSDILEILKINEEQLSTYSSLIEKAAALGISLDAAHVFAHGYKIPTVLALRVLTIKAMVDSSRSDSPTALIDPTWDKQQVTSIKCKKSGSGNITWLCVLDGGKELYIRQTNKDRWINAGYTQIESMKIGDEWAADITCYTVPGDKGFLDCQHVVSGGTLVADLGIERRNEVSVLANDWVYGLETYYFLDTETTGKEADDEVIEIAIVDNTGNLILDTRVRPTRPSSPEAEAIHGISAIDLADATLITDITIGGQPLSAWLQEHKLVSYGGQFDEDRIMQSFRARGAALWDFSINCAMTAYAKFNGEKHDKTGDWKYIKLSDACTQMGLPDTPNHSALSDALAALALVQALADYDANEPF